MIKAITNSYNVVKTLCRGVVRDEQGTRVWIGDIVVFARASEVWEEIHLPRVSPHLMLFQVRDVYAGLLSLTNYSETYKCHGLIKGGEVLVYNQPVELTQDQRNFLSSEKKNR